MHSAPAQTQSGDEQIWRASPTLVEMDVVLLELAGRTLELPMTPSLALHAAKLAWLPCSSDGGARAGTQAAR